MGRWWMCSVRKMWRGFGGFEAGPPSLGADGDFMVGAAMGTRFVLAFESECFDSLVISDSMYGSISEKSCLWSFRTGASVSKGVVLEQSGKCKSNPINSSPFEEGWMIKVKPSNPAELDSLLGPKEYTKFCEEEDAAH
ncbi:hypothetical protein Syun_030025 [Stephania yunnanensis]|uniref:Glycine cleavage system H protein n=1 Tax=Stephania yunnanensis TaxID=152371 RepID=A0AAP0HKE3_9MAGN